MGTTVRVIKQFFLGSNCYSVRTYNNAPDQLVAFASNSKYKEYACVVPEKPKLNMGGRSVKASNVKSAPVVEVDSSGVDSSDVITTDEYMPLDEYKALRSLDQEQYISSIIDTASEEQLRAYLQISKAKVADLISDKLAQSK